MQKSRVWSINGGLLYIRKKALPKTTPQIFRCLIGKTTVTTGRVVGAKSIDRLCLSNGHQAQIERRKA